MDNNENQKDIYRNLRNLRRARGLTVHKLAEQIGENHQKVGRVERGRKNLTIDYLLKISRALNTPIQEILNENQDAQGSGSVKANATLLNEIVMFIEENQMHIPSCNAQKKGELVSQIYESLQLFSESEQSKILGCLLRNFRLLLDTNSKE